MKTLNAWEWYGAFLAVLAIVVALTLWWFDMLPAQVMARLPPDYGG
jgi:hypothetical protein